MTKIGRNDPCPCGKKRLDGEPMKYKKCCEEKDAIAFTEDAKKAEKLANDKWRRKFWSHEPYTLCPKCTTMTFARTTVNSRGYTKQCYDCGYSETYHLPKLKKKIIYLDQFVIDNFVKTLDPTHPKHAKVKENPFWLEAYKKLDVLSKAHLIVCPDSYFHRDESAPTGYFESMQRIYEHLSGGVTFYNEAYILKAQMEKHFVNYLHGKPTEFPDVNPSEIVHGELNEWHDWIRVSVNSKPTKEEVEQKIKEKERIYKDFLAIFESWRTEKGINFEDTFQAETKGFVTGTSQVIARYVKRRAELPDKLLAGGQIEMDDVFPPSSFELVSSLVHIAIQEGAASNTEEAIKKVGEYFNSGYLNVIPSMRIGSSLYALMADQAAKGRVHPPTPGVHVDVQMISSFLPYCDAMFVDDENTAFLQDGRVKAKVGYPTNMFSLRNKEEFLNHLDEILTSADPKHIELIRQVYGDDCLNPYTAILEQKD